MRDVSEISLAGEERVAQRGKLDPRLPNANTLSFLDESLGEPEPLQLNDQLTRYIGNFRFFAIKCFRALMVKRH